MALVPGGEDTDLITGITHGDTVNVTFGRWVWIAQTFTLDQDYLAWRCATKAGYLAVLPVRLQYGIRYTAAGEPTGEDMDSAEFLPPVGQTTPGGLWYAQNFPTWNNLGDGLWALIIRAPGATAPWSFYVRAAPTLPPGVVGKAWKSTNSGATWSEIAGYFLLHQVWGTPRTAQIPPGPVISNWAPLSYRHTPIPDGYQVQVTTNIPAHLYMRYSLNPPLKHQVERFRRGLAMPWNTYYCFTSWHENQQDEAGDTLVHTFTKTNWPVCQTRWFYFTASKRLYPTPSASPIYQLHRPEVTFLRFAYSREFTWSGSTWWMNVDNGLAETFTAPAEGVANTHVYLFTQNNDSVVVHVHLYEVDEDDKPTGDPLASTPINLVDGTVVQDFDEHQLVYQHTPTLIAPLEAGRHYALVCITISGTAKWWIRFRRTSWEGPMDRGEENHVTQHRTRDAGQTWEDAYPGRQCYECYGYQA